MTIIATRKHGSGYNLTDDEIAYIQTQFNNRVKPSDVARDIGCSSTTVERWYSRFRDNMPAHRAPKQNADPYDLQLGPLCRHADCQAPGTGKPPYCQYHRPSPPKPSVILPWVIPPERLRAGR